MVDKKFEQRMKKIEEEKDKFVEQFMKNILKKMEEFDNKILDLFEQSLI